ncbi:MAG: class I SAM-dependent rRNA methyltransferase [Anaerolineae bacterium]|jgi:23S rRNA (cytosine1962-C5)-methyltransferase
MSFPRLTLKPKRDRSVRQRHPWLFSGAIARSDDGAQDGELVDVFSSGGEWLARGYLNRRSQIAVRLLTWEQEQAIDDAFWRARLERAMAGRAALQADPGVTAYRLVNAESDGLPGLVVDRYGEWLVLQALTLGVEQCKGELVRALMALDLGEVRGVYERSDVEVREKEGLEAVTGLLWGEEPPDLVEISEHGYRFLVDLKAGHKTGFYLDQRENRARLPAYCAGTEALNAFAYSGAFGVYALSGGAAHVTHVDTSEEALTLARRHVQLNGMAEADVTCEVADVFAQLRAYRAVGRQFDLIVLDPPRFARSYSHIKRASRGYKDINWIAFQLIRTGGVLMTFSCSGLVSRELFQKIVFGAALDAGRDVQIVAHLSQAADHPISLNFPEAAYLKGLICRVW